jgi:hypothetical protein
VLDYSYTTSVKHGAVLLHQASARHVPERSGVYQIIPTPYTFEVGKKNKAIKDYIASRNASVLDYKKYISSSAFPRNNCLSIELHQPTENINLDDLPDEITELIRTTCTFFPPIYVGQAISLKERFGQHAQGRNSDIKEGLKKAGLGENFTIFRWIELPENGIDAVERMLVKSIKPDLNNNLR